MKVNINREDIYIFRQYLYEKDECVPDSSSNEYVVRKMGKIIRDQLKDPPIMAPDKRSCNG